jgi:P4 family phage/plasmid primase-like protien
MTSAALNAPKDYAICYHSMGFSVIIVKNDPAEDRKKPAVDWKVFQIMRPSRTQIERWFSKNPNYNLGIVMGSISGNAICIDVDGPTAQKTLEEKRMKMSTNLRVAFDNTMVVKSGGGGLQIIFRVIDGSIGDISQEELWTDGKPHSQILLQGNGHYFATAPSIHPNKNHYEWNGKAPSLITRRELDEFIRLLIPSQDLRESRPPQNNIVYSSGQDAAASSKVRTLDPEQMQELLSWVKPYYTPGNRDHIIFYLSGMMRKSNFSHEAARRFITLLCNVAEYSDEDLDKSLTVVDNTYRKPINELNGKSGLHDLLVTSFETSADYDSEQYQQRAEAFSQICQIINEKPVENDDGEQSSSNNNIINSAHSSSGCSGNNNNKPAKVVKSTQVLLRQRAFDDEITRIVSYLADEVMARIPFKTLYDTGEILYYDFKEKAYRFGGETMIDILIEQILKEINAPYTVRSKIKQEVKKCIADNTRLYRSDFDTGPYTISLENCILDSITQKQIAHSPEHLILTKFPVKYDPAADCPKIKKFLSQVIMDPYKLKELLKFRAYILIKDCRYEKGSLLLGSGGNGKSVFIKINEAMVGEQNCSHLSLHDIEDDRFARARLFGKVLNTYADNKSQRLKETGNLKTVISGDTIEAQEKFKPRFSFRNKAKVEISTNNPPETEDKTHAFYRRWNITSFDRTFASSDDPDDPNRKDTTLIEKLTTPQELSGYLNLWLRYLPILIKENGFAEEPIDKVKREYEYKADHVARYLQEYCIIDANRKDNFTKTSELYEHYCRVCNEFLNVRPLDENVFGSKLVEHGILRRKRRSKGSRDYVYEPVILKYKQEEEQESKSNLFSYPSEDSNVEDMPSTEEEPAITDCPYCELENQAGNSPLFKAKTHRELQIHIVLEHPGRDFEDLE